MYDQQDPLSGGPSTTSTHYSVHTSHTTDTKHSNRSRRSEKKHKAKIPNDLKLGPKRGWTEQQNLVMSRKFHEEMLKKAHSYIGKELNEHERRLKVNAVLFDQSTAQDNARKFAEKKTSEENKRLLKRLLKVEMQETEITKTNAPGCAEKVRFRRQKKARKKALRASKQHKVRALQCDHICLFIFILSLIDQRNILSLTLCLFLLPSSLSSLSSLSSFSLFQSSWTKLIVRME